MSRSNGKKRFYGNRIIMLIIAGLFFAVAVPVYAGAEPYTEVIFVPVETEEISSEETEETPAAETEETTSQGTEEPQPEETEPSVPVKTEAEATPSEGPQETPTASPSTKQQEEAPLPSASVEALPEVLPEADMANFSIVTDGLETNEVMVDNFADLKKVLEDYSVYAGVDTIYLNGDISYQAGGIGINPSRNAITIVGHPKGQQGRYAINDITGGQGAVVRVQKNGFNLTIKDAVINGKNYYGAFTVPDIYTGVTTTYESVAYTGPQITYNRRGTARYLDSTITSANTGGDPAQEVGELAQLEIGGNTTFTNTSGTTSMFWFAGNTGSNQYLKVLNGANVTVNHTSSNSPYGFLYVEGAGGTTNQKPEITIGANASLSVTTRVGFTHTGHRVESIEIKPSGRLRINQASDPGNYPTVYVNSAIIVGAGGTLEMQRGANTRTNGLIRFYDAGGRMVLNDPHRIQLYNPYGRVITTRTGTATISGTVGAINAWTTDSGYTNSIDNVPANIWNKNDSSAMALDVTMGNSAVTAATVSNRTEGDPFTADFSSATFNTYAMPMLVMGRYTLEVNDIYTEDAEITGTAADGADIRAGYTDSEASRTLAATADASGAYSLTVTNRPLPQGTKILVTSHKNYLKARHIANVLVPPGVLRFASVPGEIPFLTGQVSALPQVVSRQDANWTMAVEDSRGNKTAWRVDARLAQPLSGTYGGNTYTLPGALVYVDGAGAEHALGAAPLTVYQAAGGEAHTDIRWAADKGVLVSVGGGQGNPNVAYGTTVEWTLIDAP